MCHCMTTYRSTFVMAMSRQKDVVAATKVAMVIVVLMHYGMGTSIETWSNTLTSSRHVTETKVGR